jgi:hypothetical protein
MAWYYYTGSTILSIPVGNGEVVAARPYSTIFVDASIENSASFKRLGKVLRRTGAPKGGVDLVPAQPIAQVAVDKPHLFSDSFVEGKAALTTKAKVVADAPLPKSADAVLDEPVAAPVVAEDAPSEPEVDAPAEEPVEVEAASDESVVAPTRRRRASAKTETD